MKPIQLALLALLFFSACSKQTGQKAESESLSPEVIAEEVWAGMEEFTYENYLFTESDFSQFELDDFDLKGAKLSLKAMTENLRHVFGRESNLSKEDFTLIEKEIEPISVAEAMNPPKNAQKITYLIRESFGDEHEDSSLEFLFIELKPGQWKILGLRLEPKM